MIIERALISKKEMNTKRTFFVRLLDNVLLQKRKRIVTTTIFDFRKHALKEKAFRRIKCFLLMV